MTDHTTLKMHREHVRVTDRDMINAMLDMTSVCNVALHDEPYPYTVPMNFGYEWVGDELVFWLHMAVDGHRIELIKQNPKVAVNVHIFLDRVGHKPFRREAHDYRSVNAFGEAQILNPYDEPDEYLRGFGIFCQHTGRPAPKKIIPDWYKRLLILKITCPAELVMGKTQYDCFGVEDIPIPSIEDVDAGNCNDPFRGQPTK